MPTNIKHLRRATMLTLSLVITLLVVVNIFVSAQFSHLGLKVQESNLEAHNIQKEIELIEIEILTQSSLSTIQETASNFGFVDDYRALALPVKETVAYKP